MVIDPLMQAESHPTKFIELIRVLDVIADLVIDDAGRVYKSCERQVALLANGMAVTRDVIEPH
jgi:hypothetical protein